jgi:hypothetical protein
MLPRVLGIHPETPFITRLRRQAVNLTRYDWLRQISMLRILLFYSIMNNPKPQVRLHWQQRIQVCQVFLKRKRTRSSRGQGCQSSTVRKRSTRCLFIICSPLRFAAQRGLQGHGFVSFQHSLLVTNRKKSRRLPYGEAVSLASGVRRIIPNQFLHDFDWLNLEKIVSKIEVSNSLVSKYTSPIINPNQGI